jgi:hypothetical protein
MQDASPMAQATSVQLMEAPVTQPDSTPFQAPAVEMPPPLPPFIAEPVMENAPAEKLSAVPPPLPVQATEVAATAAPAPAQVEVETVDTPTPASVAQSFGSALAGAMIDQIPDAAPLRTEPRLRRKYTTSDVSSEPLMAVETRTDTVPPVLTQPEPVRRSTPRPRRQQAVSNEPLVFVETQKQDKQPQT